MPVSLRAWEVWCGCKDLWNAGWVGVKWPDELADSERKRFKKGSWQQECCRATGTACMECVNGWDILNNPYGGTSSCKRNERNITLTRTFTDFRSERYRLRLDAKARQGRDHPCIDASADSICANHQADAAVTTICASKVGESVRHFGFKFQLPTS
jgi:hypothetical protein